MSLNPDIRDRAYQFFIEEAQELLQVLETGLLEIRDDHSTPKVHELMRAAHSIKGGAASVELSAIELLAHRLEDFFKALYSDEVEFDAELESLLLQGYDCLSNPLIQQIESGSYDEEAALLTAEPIFAALEVRLEDALKNADNYIPSSNDLGVDIVSSIFEVDVVQAIERLQEIADNPASFDLTQEFQETLDMLTGFAELFNLSGFSDIVQTAQTALNQNPDRVLNIIRATINDCTIAKDLVLAGDRDRGGEVSPVLRELAQSEISETISLDSDDVFGEAIVNQDDDLWSSTPAPVDSIDDVFGAVPNTPVAEEDNLFAEVPDAAVDSIDDVFGAVPDTPVAEADNLFAEVPDAPIDSIDDVFGAVPDTSVAEENNLFAEVPDAPVDSIDDVFGAVPDTSVAEENNIFAEVPDAPVDSIDDVFGNVPETISKETIDDVNQIFDSVVNATPAEDSDKSPQSENIADAVKTIENIFDRLPSVEANSADSSFPIAKTPNKQSQASSAAKTKASKSGKTAAKKLSVRVDLERLERMNNLVGELTINRNSLALQNNQLQEGVSELGQKFLRFQGVTQKLREISDRMILEQRSQNLSSYSSPVVSNSDNLAEFDSLEMDSYSGLYGAVQNLLEEIVQLEESVDDITIFAKQSDRTINSQRQMLNQMRDELMWVRMLPLDGILQRFPRTLRDLANKYQKPVDLKLTGTGVLVDKAVLEKLSDPLLHLLRNGFDHGIESSDVRENLGKPKTGTIEIHAYYQGNQTVIEVKDDGKGLDVEKIAKKGIEKGLISASEVATANKERLYDLIFEPGFSTASKVSEISGRGVGMNIVRSQIETLKGKISVISSPGEGSTFTLRLPLTLTIAKLLVCSLGSTSFAIPSDSIEEIVIPTEAQIKIANQQKFVFLNGDLIPIYPLKEILQYNCPVADIDRTSKAFKTIAPPEDWFAPLLLLRRGQKLYALEVVNLISEQELVIKPYGKAIAAPEYSYGCTILGDGSLIPAFNGSALIGSILGEDVTPLPSANLSSGIIDTVDIISDSEDLAETSSNSSTNGVTATNQVTTAKTIMIVDDSTALRRTMALTLEKQGYRVIQKKDGRDALDGFRQNPKIDLIICDVEMPTMNGFEFLGMRRRDSRLSQVPTFMLTSRSGAKHRNLAKQLGADGYFTKPYVEQEFVAEVKKILGNNISSVTSNTSRNVATINKKTILIIDDSSALRRTLSLSLEKKGYQVLQGRDGIEGLELLRKNLQTDLVICDVEMPNMNGFEFLTSRRQDSNLATIPTIMLTSRSTDKHRSLANSLGADGYFTKPYIQDRFLEDIDSFIKKYSKTK